MLKDNNIIILSLLIFFISFAIYLQTLAPSVTWTNNGEDSGDIIASANILGIPHPTGYPLIMLVGRIATVFIPFGDIAFRFNLLSALLASLTVVLCGLITFQTLDVYSSIGGLSFNRTFNLELLRIIYCKEISIRDRLYHNVLYLLPFISALLSALILGFSVTYWSQAVIGEVYSFNSFFILLSLFVVIKWSFAVKKYNVQLDLFDGFRLLKFARFSDEYLYLFAFLFGLSLTAHLSAMFVLPACIFIIVSSNWRELLRVRIVLICILLFLLPLLLYLYLPIRSSHNPAMDWGNPETFKQMKWVITAEQYRFRMFHFSIQQMISKIYREYSPVFEFSYIGVIIGIIGLMTALLKKRFISRKIAISIILLFLADIIYIANYDIPDPSAYYIPAHLVFSICIGWGIFAIFKAIVYLSTLKIRNNLIASFIMIFFVMIFITLPNLFFAMHYRSANANDDYTPINYGKDVFNKIEPNALIISEYDGYTFALWYCQNSVYKSTHKDVVVLYKYLFMWDWYIKNINKLYPDIVIKTSSLNVPLVMNDIVVNNIANRPIYFIRKDPDLSKNFSFSTVISMSSSLGLHRIVSH